MNIHAIINKIKYNWHMYMPEKNTETLNKSFHQEFPYDYLLFIKELGEGSYQFENLLFSSWCSESVIENNKAYEINKYLGKDLVGIATDGGGICFLLDFRNKGEPKFSAIGLGDLDIEEIIVLASSFTKALQLMIEKKITLENIL